MGCCQTSSMLNADQVCLFPELDLNPKKNSTNEEHTSCRQRDSEYNQNTEPQTRIYSIDDQFSLYVLSEKVLDFPFGSKYVCTHQVLDLVKVSYVITKQLFPQDTLKTLIQQLVNFAQLQHAHISKIFYICEDEVSLSILVEQSEEYSLRKAIDEKRMFSSFVDELLKATYECYKAKISLPSLSVDTVLIVAGTLQVSPLAVIETSLNPSHFSEARFFDSLGRVLLCMLTLRSEIGEVSKTLKSLAFSSLNKDFLNALLEVFSDHRNTATLFDALLREGGNLDLPLHYFTGHSGQDFKNDRSSVEIVQVQQIKVSKTESCEDELLESNLIEFENTGSQKIKICEILQEDIKDLLENNNEEKPAQNDFSFEIKESAVCSSPDYESNLSKVVYESPLELLSSNDEDYEKAEEKQVSVKPSSMISEDSKEHLEDQVEDYEGTEKKEKKDAFAEDFYEKNEAEEEMLEWQPNTHVLNEEIQEKDQEIELVYQEDSAKSIENQQVLENSSSSEVSPNKKELFQQKNTESYSLTKYLVNDGSLQMSIDSLLSMPQNPSLNAQDSLENPCLLSESPPKPFVTEKSEYARSSEKNVSPFELAIDAESINTSVNVSEPRLSDSSHVDYRQLYRSTTEFKPKLEQRLSRVSLSNEKVVLVQETGTLKFYSSRNRYGFIVKDLDKADVFVCEDDLVLSGVSIRKVKNALMSKKTLAFRFNVIEYEKEGKTSKKAVNLELVV